VIPPETLETGDFYINNDPYQGGQHLQDVFIYSPIFFEGELVGFAGSVSHHLDLGGGNPGLTPDAADVHAEGIIFPPSVYNFERDWNGGPLERLVAANIRAPDQTIGDFYAQFASNAIGSERVRQLCQRYGTAKVTQAMTDLIDYSERRFRAALAAIPDGDYFGEDAVDDDGLTDTPLTVRAKVSIRGDAVSVDYDGTCPQVTRNINCPFASTISATLAAVKSTLTSPDIPFNEGMKRPVSVSAPKGCLVNPKYPAPVRARMLSAYRCFDAVLKALAQVAPDRVISSGNDTTHSLAISHLGEEKYRVYLEIYGGGFGASARVDGCDGVDSALSNCTNTPVEATDMDFDHFRVIGYGLVPDSGGSGRRRGGLGLWRSFEVLKDDTNFACYSDRARIAPWGLFGGAEGGRTRITLERDGKVIALPTKTKMDLKRGDVLTIYTAGGGGYGPPAERDGWRIAEDIRNGYVSREAAVAAYGRTG
jgi:N-methylhydantoinase B